MPGEPRRAHGRGAQRPREPRTAQGIPDRPSRPQIEPRSKARSKPKQLSDPRSSPDRHEIGHRSGSRSQIKSKTTQIRTRCGPHRGRFWCRSPAPGPQKTSQGGEQKENKNEAKGKGRSLASRSCFVNLTEKGSRANWSNMSSHAGKTLIFKKQHC